MLTSFTVNMFLLRLSHHVVKSLEFIIRVDFSTSMVCFYD